MTRWIIVTKKIIKYNTGFSTGSLLFKESEAIISNIQNADSFLVGDEVIPFNVIPVNSESSQKRLYREVSKRLKSLNNPMFIDLYQTGNREDKLLILFYAACKMYQVIADFMLDTVLSKWYNMDKEVSAFDFQSFLYKQMDSHPELESLAPNTLKKLSQVVMRMLSELGMQKNNTLHKVVFNQRVLEAIATNGDSWYLEVVLLNENERQEILGR